MMLISETTVKVEAGINKHWKLPMFRVTKYFMGGLLAGLTHTEVTCVKWDAGDRVLSPIGGDPYLILIVERL